MPPTLRRRKRRKLTLARSIVNALLSKVFSSVSPDPAPHDRYDTCAGQKRYIRRSISRVFRPVHFIHYLPPELLAIVFTLGAQDDTMFPVTVSHVCRTWRHIALQTPSLWRRISLGPAQDMWVERMHRARACSLDIELRSERAFVKRPLFFDVHSVQWHMYIVNPYIFRWRSLDIMFTYRAPYLWNAALSGCCRRSRRAHAPLIEEVSLVYRYNDDTKEYTLFDGVAPKLRRLTIDGLRLAWLPSLFANLTYLNYTHHGFTYKHQAVGELLNMLTVSNRIQELRVLFPWKVSHQSMAPARSVPKSTAMLTKIVLPALVHLHLLVDGHDVPSELHFLMANLSAPCLLSLHLLDVAPAPARHPFSRLSTFLRTFLVPPSLVALRVEYGWYDHRFVNWLFKILPNLEQAILRDPRAPERVFINLQGNQQARRQ